VKPETVTEENVAPAAEAPKVEAAPAAEVSKEAPKAEQTQESTPEKK
jgi:large subunit ribosomal protein L19